MSLSDRYRKRYENSLSAADEGFTLIELLVVLLIIGILLAIAIPTFLGVTKSANNTAAQSNLQTALTGAKAFYTNNTQSYGASSAALVTGIQGIGTGLSYGTTASTGNNVLSVASADSTEATIVAYSPGTTDCWGIIDLTATETTAIQGVTAVGTYFYVQKSVASPGTACNAATINGSATLTANSTIQTSGGFPPG